MNLSSSYSYYYGLGLSNEGSLPIKAKPISYISFHSAIALTSYTTFEYKQSAHVPFELQLQPTTEALADGLVQVCSNEDHR